MVIYLQLSRNEGYSSCILVLNLKSRYFTIDLCFLFSKLNAFLYVAHDKVQDENLVFESQRLSRQSMDKLENKTSRTNRRHGK